MRVVEWFSGIGGCAAALGPSDAVVWSVDQGQWAHETYSLWWPHPTVRKNIQFVRAAAVPPADLWWMSPPCQPYSIRGNQRDLQDRRSGAFLNVLDLFDTHRPAHLAMENVPWFEGSQGHARLRTCLARAGYSVWDGVLCPTDFGIPMVRRRFFLAASRTGDVSAPTPAVSRKPLRHYVDVQPPAGTAIPTDIQQRFADALHIVDADDPNATTACFTGAYAHSPVYAGSYLRDHGSLRLFAPHEVLALMGFPRHLRLPADLTQRRAYKLVGNSVSVDCVRAVLDTLST